MRIEFINSVGGKMLVDESRKDEYIAAGFKLAADIVDSTARVIEPAPKKTARRKKKED